MNTTSSSKIIIADNSFIARKGLKTLITERGYEFVAEADDSELTQKTLESYETDVLITKHDRDSFSSDFIIKVRASYPSIGILVITKHESGREILRLMNNGIKNFLVENCEEQDLLNALSACLKREKFFCSRILELILETELGSQSGSENNITERELEVIHYLVGGLKPKQIAQQMKLSYHTIIAHKRNIYSKLGIRNTIGLAQYAISRGLVKA